MTTQVEPGSHSPPDSPLHYTSNPTSPIRKKRERQLSRNSRPPGSADGVLRPSPSIVNHSHLSPSSSHDTLLHQQNFSTKSFMSLPLFVPKTTGSHSPASPDSSRVSRTLSMQESSSSSLSPSRRANILSSSNYPPLSPRSRLLPSIGHPGEGRRPSLQEGRSNSPFQARRWSTAVSGHRNSTGLAYRLAEGASPYLRAGLDELRSIFDVDSDPIPISALDEDDSTHEEEGNREVLLDLSSPTAEIDNPTFPSRVDRSTSLDGSAGTGMGLGLYKEPAVPSRSSTATTSNDSKEKMAPVRTEDGTFDVGFSAAGLGINRGILAWSLAFIAGGLTSLCAYGYAMHSDTFSTTLIGFFLTQPAFSLMGLIALLLRRRALMDLFSRAMRAHVLAQACIVLMAYLDLSASSFYVSPSGRKRVPFRMVPTMEMRFGPSRGAIEAGDTPGINLLYSSSSRSSAESLSMSDSIRDHSRDTHVGDFQSRLIHLIVFIVQAALPIVAILLGQYIAAQRLAWLARRTSASRQNSMNLKNKLEKTSPTISRRSTLSGPRYDSKTLPLSQSFSSDIQASRQTAELYSPPVSPISGRPGARRSKHTRSLSQPLDFLNSALSEKRETDSSKSILSLPLSDSPPLQD